MYSDLSKQEIVDKYRHFNVEHDWWDYIYEDFVEYVEEKGISTTTKDMSFTGFWSQGDGASYEGTIHSSDMKRFMDAHDLSTQYESAYFFAELEQIYVTINRTSSHYCHSHTMRISLSDEIWDDYGEGSVRSEVYQVMERDFNNNFQALEKRIEEICRGYADELYHRLQEEYEYQTSDEVVIEALEANGIFEQPNEGEKHGLCSD
jgi:hypothetical protein